MNPEYLEKWFPIEQQRSYVSMLVKRGGGLTKRRAEYFVRLWAYLLVKQLQESDGRLVQPLTKLELPQGWVACTHKEAAELFYGEKDRGGDRAAGMMLNQLAALGLIEKHFDGNTTCIQIVLGGCDYPPPEPVKPVELIIDDFNPRTDAVPVANLIDRHYVQTAKDATATPHQITRTLRDWAKQYSTGMRVLRRSDNLHPVGISIIYPTVKESEANFFLPPGKTRFLTSDMQNEPFKMAVKGDEDCSSAFLRACLIDNPYMEYETLCDFVEDLQKTLVKVQVDFPNLCDLHSVAINPFAGEISRVLGFQRTYQDTQRPIYRIYIPVDRFLALNVRQILSGLKLQPTSEKAKKETVPSAVRRK
ncbi:hypothetical protein ACE1CI_25565 [Aerosakkonemataceae cyanobacterium BLCC-F50]|uniref:LAGLIDADG homing endonuclease n=1 Tax=Floridaenema flaviceps BLCC-F50 TaxID=3153642 RepID=A0ABV4XX23_9CYAN